MILSTLDPTPLDESLRRLETLVSKYTGVVRSRQRFLAATDDAPLVSVACELADARDLIGTDVDARAIAWAPSRRAATAAAIGEAAERYSASWLPEARLVLASAADTPSYRASRALFLVAALVVAVPALYVALSNLGLVPITGQNMPFLGLNAWSDVAICAGVVGILVTGAMRSLEEGAR